MAYIEKVDVDKAFLLLGKFTAKLDKPEYEAAMDQLQKEAKELIHGLILTAIHTGLIEDKPEKLSELRAKLTVVLCSGFIVGKEGMSFFRDI